MADYSKYQNQENQTSNPFKISTFVLAALLFVATAMAVYYATDSNKFQSRTAMLETEVGNLNETQANLTSELSGLEDTYTEQVSLNEQLTTEIEQKEQDIKGLKWRISEVKKQLSNSEQKSSEMQARLARLETLKTEMETELVALKDANVELQNSNALLGSDLETSRGEVAALNIKVAELTKTNDRMENRLGTLAPAGFTAGNFRVDMETRRDKLTAKARQTREVKVKFDINDVPNDLHGNREIYLAVTDLSGNPLTVIPTTTVNVPTPSETLKVDVADIEQVELDAQQTITMSFEPEDKMTAGEYNLLVYSDAGYLGSTGFRLR